MFVTRDGDLSTTKHSLHNKWPPGDTVTPLLTEGPHELSVGLPTRRTVPSSSSAMMASSSSTTYSSISSAFILSSAISITSSPSS
ncbi:unnamed protein product, partial [Nesidiocoris tenuis]